MTKKLKIMKKLFDECKRNPETPDIDIILPPINPKPNKWWRGNIKKSTKYYLKKIMKLDNDKEYVISNGYLFLKLLKKKGSIITK